MNETTWNRPTGRIKRLRAIAAATAATAALSAGASAQCQYEIVEPFPIQGPDCWLIGPQPTYPVGLNSHGWVAGYYRDCWDTDKDHAFVWMPGIGLTTLPTPPGVLSARASGLNDDGFIIGQHRFGLAGWKAFVFNPHTQQYTYLEALHGDIGPTQTVSSVTAINNDLVITGSRIISAPGESLVRNAVLWMPFGKGGDGVPLAIDLGVGDGPNSGANGGSDEMVAAGWTGTTQTAGNSEAVVWTASQMVPLGFLPAATSSHATAVNNKLQVVGGSRNGVVNPFRGFLWEDGLMVELAPPPPFDRFHPSSIADGEQIVGILVDPSVGLAVHAGMWQQGNFYQVESLIDAVPAGLHLKTPRAINNNGQILSEGQIAGKQVGVLLVPFDVPVGDLTLDCEVNVGDLVFLLKEWGKHGSKADLTGNGTVGVPDLLLLLANWS